MNIRKLDLNLLAVFDAIYAEGNLTRASRRLGLSQPAMSNALSRLRAALGDDLFTRTAYGMNPTWRARRLADPVRQALSLIQAGVREGMAFDPCTSDRTFVIAVEDYGEVVVMPRLMNMLARHAPGIRLKIRPERGSALTQELADGSVDLAMDYRPVRADILHVEHLLDETFVPLVRAGHPRIGDTLGIDEYVALPHVVFAQRSPGGSMIDRELRKRGLQRRIALEVPHFLSMPLIVQHTDFVCTIPKRMSDVYLEQFALKALPPPMAFPPVPLYLIWNRALTDDPGHRWLRDRFRAACGDAAGGAGSGDPPPAPEPSTAPRGENSKAPARTPRPAARRGPGK